MTTAWISGFTSISLHFTNSDFWVNDWGIGDYICIDSQGTYQVIKVGSKAWWDYIEKRQAEGVF